MNRVYSSNWNNLVHYVHISKTIQIFDSHKKLTKNEIFFADKPGEMVLSIVNFFRC